MQWSVRQVADLCKVPADEVRRWIRERGLPAVVFHEQYHLNRVDLLVWAQANRVPLPEALLEPQPAHPISLEAALARGGIHRDVQAEGRSAILRAALERVVLPAAIDRELLLEMLLARESRGSTAIGHGIAIPHARYPLIADTQEPILALCHLAEAVDFGAPDGEPVRALFVLIAPTTRTHLHLLSRLANALTTAFLSLVRDRASDAELLAAARDCDAAAEHHARAHGGATPPPDERTR